MPSPAAHSYLWLDPGKTTGWAAWYAEKKFYSGQQLGLLKAAACVDNFIAIAGAPSTRVGWEAFTIRPGSAHLNLDVTALEVIGAVRWIISQSGATALKPSQPADRMLGERHLKAVGWHNPAKEHANAAAAHLLSYCITENILPAYLMEKVTERARCH